MNKKRNSYGYDISIDSENNQKNSTFEIHNDDVDYLVIDMKIAINEGYEYKRIIMNDNGWELTDTR